MQNPSWHSYRISRNRRSDRNRCGSGANGIETPNLAARLQGIAEPNTVVMARAPESSSGIFEPEDLGRR